MRKEPIRNVELRDVFYLDLRYWGYDWFDALDLPNAYVTTYVMQCEYVAWVTSRRYRFIQVRCPLFDEVLFTLWDHYYVFAFGSIRELTTSHTFVNFAYCTLLCSLSAIGIDCSMSMPLVFDLTFTMEGGREGTVAASPAA